MILDSMMAACNSGSQDGKPVRCRSFGSSFSLLLRILPLMQLTKRVSPVGAAAVMAVSGVASGLAVDQENSPSGLASAAQLNEWNPVPQTCQRIEATSVCGDMPYNFTTMPNLVGHQDISEATGSLNSFKQLIQHGCSSFTKFFLCSVYFPMCTRIPPTETIIVVPPCRPLCLEVHDKCLPVLEQFGYAWPASLNCDQYPEANKKDDMCMPGPMPSPTVPVEKTRPPLFRMTFPPLVPTPDPAIPLCPQENGLIFVNFTNRCALACESNIITSQDEKNAAEIFHGVLASACLLLGIVAFLVNICRPVRISTQEKPVLYILFCLMMVSAGYILRLSGGRRFMGCTGDDEAYVVIDGFLEAKSCIGVFVLLYYFGFAGNMWWMMLVVMWFYSNVKEAKQKHLEKVLKNTHVVAWVTSVVPTIVVLVMKLIDADELAGVCYVGQQNPTSLLALLLIPLALITGTGALLLLRGILICRRRRVFLNSSDSKSTKISISDGSSTQISSAQQKPSTQPVLGDQFLLFKCALFLFSSALMIACYTAEYSYQEFWTIAGSHGLPVFFYFIRVLMQYAYPVTIAVWYIIAALTPPVPLKTPLKVNPHQPNYQIPSAYHKLDPNFFYHRQPATLPCTPEYASILVDPTPTEASSAFSTSTRFPTGGHFVNNKLAAHQQQQLLVRQELSKRSLHSVACISEKEGHETFV